MQICIKLGIMRRVNTVGFYNSVAILYLFLFAYTAFSKLFSYRVYKVVLAQSPIIGNQGYWVALAIPIVELVLVLLLIVPRMRRVGMYSSIGLLLLFSGYIAYMLLSDIRLPCSCGGVLKELSWKQHLWFNLSFIGLGCIALRVRRISHSINGFSGVGRQHGGAGEAENL